MIRMIQAVTLLFVALHQFSPGAQAQEVAEAAPPSPLENGIAKVLSSHGLTPHDLRFRKNVAPVDFLLDAVKSVLDAPLSGPVLARQTAREIRTARPAEVASILGRLSDATPSPANGDWVGGLSVPGSAEAWADRWKGLLPSGATTPPDIAGKLASLPAVYQKVLSAMAERLPLAEKGVRDAFAPLSDGERETLGQYGMLLALADDARRESYLPPDPAKAEAIRKAHPDRLPLQLVLSAGGKVDRKRIVEAQIVLADLAEFLLETLAGSEGAPPPVETCRLPTRFGAITLAGPGDDRHDAEAAFVIDTGGDDLYLADLTAGASGRRGRPLAMVIDLSGDDVYRPSGAVNLGGAFLGCALLIDRAGDDIYVSGDISQGASLFGAGMLCDLGGDDIYRAEALCQGAASFGIGFLRDASGRDAYRADVFAQGFGRTCGAGALHDAAGHDSYRSGTKALYLPQTATHHFCHSQGFAIGVREHGAAGGVAILVEDSGNDVYQGEIHAQGAGCWYGLGMLVDRTGSDRYAATFNAQGGAVHESCGILVDLLGDDVYSIDNGLGQGCAHDYAVGFLLDRAGDDKYVGRAAVQGVGLTNGVGLFADMAGDDLYAAHGGHLQGCSRDTRDHRSIGVFLDLAGRDRYTTSTPGLPAGARRDGRLWRQGRFGGGFDAGVLDEHPVLPKKELVVPTLPDDYDFSPSKFRELFREASLWVVGENKPRILRARGELMAWGERAIPLLREEMGGWGTLHFWGLDGVVVALAREHGPAVAAMVLDVLNTGSPAAQANALRLAGKLGLRDAAPRILTLLKTKGWTTYAIWPAGKLRLAKAVPDLVSIAEETDAATERIEALRALGAIAAPAGLRTVLEALSSDDFAVRAAAVEGAARFGDTAFVPLLDLAEPANPTRLRLTALRSLLALRPAFRGNAARRLLSWCDDADPSVRAGAVLLLPGLTGEHDPVGEIAKRLPLETDPLVRHSLELAKAWKEGSVSRKVALRSGVVAYPPVFDD